MPRPNLLRNFLYVYMLLTALRTFPRLKLRKPNARQNLDLLLHQGKNPKLIKEALFAVALPRIYQILRRRYPRSVTTPAILSSPLLHLIDPSLRRTVAVYAATTAAVNFGRGTKPRQMLPPAWTLILIANSWLLWAFLFKQKCFPRGYGDLILRHSGYGSGEPTEQLIDFLQRTKFETFPPGTLSSSDSSSLTGIHPGHTRAVCARLHPSTLSCRDTYIKAWVNQFPQVSKWVGAFAALPLILRRKDVLAKYKRSFFDLVRARLISTSPSKAFREWVIATIRGTTFVVGTINTCWGLTCLFQRVLSPGTLPHLRWIANGILGDLWILVLPTKRRTEFALYCTRLAVVSCWELAGKWSPKFGEVVVFGLSWASLLRDRRNGEGPHGLGGLILDYIDGQANK